MSFLSSVLSSIGEESSKSSSQKPNPAQSRLQAPSVAALSSSALKRKADDLGQANPSKIARKDLQSQGRAGHGPTSRPDRHSSTLSAQTTLLGTSTKAPSLSSKPAPPTSTSHLKPTHTHLKNTPASQQPTKGSFREILARAQAAKAAQSQVGQIKHKSVIKMTKKERMAKEAEAAQQSKLDARNKKNKKTSGMNGAGNKAKGPREGEKERKKPLDLGYKGTMRSAAPDTGYKGNVRPCAPSKPAAKPQAHSGRGSGYGSGGPRYTYASYSDEEEDDEEEDDEDEYESDDMEAAGFDELEEEEMASLRYAKKEDLEAQNEENEHKRQKEERKRKLQQLAANKRR